MRLFVFFGGLLVLALLGALIAPPFIDWNQFRERFEQEASRVVGQPVRVHGQTSARLLPLPSVTFEKVRVGDDQQPMLAAQSFHINVELAPLLKGDVSIVDMVLTAPRLDLRIKQDGRLDWSARAVDLPIDFKAADVSLNRFTVRDGIIRVRDQRDQRELILRDIDLDGSAKSLAGPWRADGFFNRADQKVRLSASSGRWQQAAAKGESGQLKLKIDLQAQDIPYDVELDGPVTLRAGIPQFTGAFRVRPMTKQAGAARINFDRSKAGIPLQGKLDGIFKTGARGGVVPDYKLEVGSKDDPYIVTGTAFANFDDEGSFEINADGQQVNFARLETEPDQNQKETRTAQDRLMALHGILAQVPRFTVPGRINLTLPAVVAGDTVVRDVAVQAMPLKGGNGWKLSSLKAELPGRTELLASGDLGLKQGLSFDGSLVLASKQPSGFAGWLVDDVPAPIRSLRNAGFSGDVLLGGGNLLARNVELVLDGKQLNGSVEQVQSGDGEVALKTVLAGDEINFDAIQALATILVGADTVRQQVIDFDVQAGRLLAYGLSANQVAARGRLGPNTADLASVSVGSLEGAGLAFSGNVHTKPDGTGLSGLMGNLKGAVKADDPRGLLRLLEKRFGRIPAFARFLDDPALLANMDLMLDLSGQKEQSVLAMKGVAGGSTVDADLLVDGDDGSWLERSITLAVKLDNPRSDRLMGQLGFDVLPLDQRVAASAALSAKGVAKDGLETLASFDLAGVTGAMQGKITPSLVGQAVELSGSVDADIRSSDLDTVAALTGLALPRFGEGLGGEVQASLTFSKDRVEAERLVIRHGDMQLRGDLTASELVNGRTKLSGTLSSDKVQVENIASIALGSEGQEGNAPNRLLSGFDGSIALELDRLVLPGEAQVTASAVKGNLLISDGDFAFEKVTGTVLGGDMSGTIRLARAGEARIVRGEVVAKQIEVRRLLQSSGYPLDVAGRGNLEMSFDASAATQANLIGSMTGGGVLLLNDVELGGVDGAFLPTLLARFDNQQAAKKDATAEVDVDDAMLVQSGLFNGKVGLQKLDIPFSTASGVLRINDVGFSNSDVTGSFDAKVELQNMINEVQVDVSFQPGREALIGSSPDLTINFSGQPAALARSIDTTLLEAFLAQRGAERREREFLSQQAAILERQQLGRDSRAIVLARQAALRRSEREKALQREREKTAQEEAKRAAEEELRRKRSQDGVREPDATEPDATERDATEPDANADGGLIQRVLDGLNRNNGNVVSTQ